MILGTGMRRFPCIGKITIAELKAYILIAMLEPSRASGELETLRYLTHRIDEIIKFSIYPNLLDTNSVSSEVEQYYIATIPNVPKDDKNSESNILLRALLFDYVVTADVGVP